MKYYVNGSAIAALLLCACDPNDVPRLSPDCRYIAVLDDLGKDRKKDVVRVGIFDITKGEWRHYDLPERWSAGGLVWAGPRLLIEADRPKAIKPEKEGEPTHDVLFWVLDPATGKFHNTEPKPRIFTTPFMGTWKGKSCLFMGDPERQVTDIYTLPDISRVEALDYQVEAAGDGWLMRVLEKEDGGNILGIEVLDSVGSKVCNISTEEISKACHRGARKPECARVSSDGKQIVLGFDTTTIYRQAHTEYTYGVFSLSNGKLVWKGGSNALHGIPVMIGEAIFVLEAKSRNIYTGDRTLAAIGEGRPPRSQPTSEVVLARYTPAGREVVLELPLKKTDRAARYSASADGKTFVLLVEGEAHRLLVVPIGPKVALEDLREYPIREK